jgi:choline dehydrogenase-like flavoprotein
MPDNQRSAMKPGWPIAEYDVALSAAVSAATPARVAGAHDAIVIGAGAAGGLAALLLCEAGLKVLVLDAGWRASFAQAAPRRLTGAIVSGLADPKVASLLSPGVIYKARRALRLLGCFGQPVQTQCYAWERAPEFFVDDRRHPYVTAGQTRFAWLRVHALGGRLIVPGHGRQYYRFAPDDFAASDERPAWPICAEELALWYEAVEQRLALRGRQEGLATLPDSAIARPIEPALAEAELAARIAARWPRAHTVMSRYAPPLASLHAAAASGHLLCRQGALARAVETDGQRVCGVSWTDIASGATLSARAPLVFLCASTLESVRILLVSRSSRHPEGLGARSNVLGRFVADHAMVKLEGVGGALPGAPFMPEDGRCVYLPRFETRDGDHEAPRLSIQIYQSSGAPGTSFFNAVAFGDMGMRDQNRVTLDPERVDAWGAPVLRIACTHSGAERRAAEACSAALSEIAAFMGVRAQAGALAPPGMAVHECGGARMGEDPAASVLDPNNQCWDATGLYVTDGASFPSLGSHNPTLTIMALTARACAHALAGR